MPVMFDNMPRSEEHFYLYLAHWKRKVDSISNGFDMTGNGLLGILQEISYRFLSKSKKH